VRHLLITTAALALAAGSASAQNAAPIVVAQDAPAAGESMQQVDAAGFVAGAATGHVWVREAAALAQDRSDNDEIVSFAETLQSDHSAAIEDLLNAVEAAGLAAAIPETTTEAQEGDYRRLNEATDEDFDGAFLTRQIANLSDLVTLFRGFAENGEDSEVRQYAEDTLPLLEDHLSRAEDLATEMGVENEEADAMPADDAAADDGMADEDMAADDMAADDMAADDEADAEGDEIADNADARIIVEQPAPMVRLEQGETRVFVEQPAPEVTVQQNPPEIVVRQPAPIVRIEIPEPRVQIDMPEPEITVRVPDPDVALEMQDPQIRVEQEPPRVELVQAEPNVEVDVDEAEQAEPNVEAAEVAPIIEMGERAEPVVNIQRANPNVQFDAEDPQIEFQQAAEPQVQINRIGEQNVNVERPEDGEDDAAPAEGEMDEGAQLDDPEGRWVIGAMLTVEDADVGEFTTEEIEAATLVNENGDVLGDVEEVVELNGRQYIIIGHGGFLGLGEHEVAIPLDAIHYDGEQLVLPDVTEQDIEDRTDVDPSEFGELDDDATVNVNIQ